MGAKKWPTILMIDRGWMVNVEWVLGDRGWVLGNPTYAHLVASRDCTVLSNSPGRKGLIT
jgi:hypothetical protein